MQFIRDRQLGTKIFKVSQFEQYYVFRVNRGKIIFQNFKNEHKCRQRIKFIYIISLIQIFGNFDKNCQFKGQYDVFKNFDCHNEIDRCLIDDFNQHYKRGSPTIRALFRFQKPSNRPNPELTAHTYNLLLFSNFMK